MGLVTRLCPDGPRGFRKYVFDTIMLVKLRGLYDKKKTAHKDVTQNKY